MPVAIAENFTLFFGKVVDELNPVLVDHLETFSSVKAKLIFGNPDNGFVNFYGRYMHFFKMGVDVSC